MRVKIVVLVAGILLSGCSAAVTSRDITLDLRSDKKVNVGLNKNDSTVPSALHTTLLSESKGFVSELTDQPLILTVGFQFQPKFRNDDCLGISSLFLPFLAFVAETNNETYSVNYAIRDRHGSIVHQRSLTGTVAGTMEGWYIGRIDAARDLKKLEAEFAAKNAARLVLKDMDENAEKLFAAADTTRGASVFSAHRDNKAERGTQSAPATDEDPLAYQQAKSLNTLNAYSEFLHSHPSSPNRKEALKSMSLLIKKQGGSYQNYKKFIVEYEDGTEFVPSSYRLSLAGPEGMRIHDILYLLKQGIEDTVIAAKIRTQNAIYKDFNFEEIGALKKRGMTGVLIEAMLDSTTRAKRAQEELQKKKEMEDLLTETQRTQKKLDATKAAQEQQQQQPQAADSGRQDSGPSVGDTLKNCAARIAALEACRHLSGFAQTICKATAKSQFPCQE
jgi:hypothetical protein